MLVVYHIKIFSLAREKRAREVKICGVHFGSFRHFFTVLLFQVTYFSDKTVGVSGLYHTAFILSKLKHFLILNLVTKRCFDFILREFQIKEQLDDERSLSTLLF